MDLMPQANQLARSTRIILQNAVRCFIIGGEGESACSGSEWTGCFDRIICWLIKIYQYPARFSWYHLPLDRQSWYRRPPSCLKMFHCSRKYLRTLFQLPFAALVAFCCLTGLQPFLFFGVGGLMLAHDFLLAKCKALRSKIFFEILQLPLGKMISDHRFGV